MDITYHYPPELFELIISVIPLLCRSKIAVINFFEGAGVSNSYLYALKEKVNVDRDAI